MVSRAIAAGAAAAGLALGAAACGPAKHQPASALTTNPVVRKDVKTEQALINKCLAHGTVLTKSGRKAFYTCASGGQTPAKFEACATKQLTATSLLTKTGRDAWLAAVASKCVVTS